MAPTSPRRPAPSTLFACAILLVVLLAPATAHGGTERIAGGAWSYFGDPRAVYAHGLTFVGSVSAKGTVQVRSIDAAGHVRSSTLDYMGLDDHNHPSLLVRPDGRIVAFYAPHENYLITRSRRYAMYYRTTRKPYDIRTWGPVRRLPGNTAPLPGQPRRGVAYPNPIQMKNGQTWLFWRGGSWWPSFTWTKDLQHWKTPRNVVRGIVGLRPYTKYASDGRNVYLAFTESHPNKHHTSIYFLRISEDGTIYDDRRKRVGDVAHGADYRRAGVVYRYSPENGNAWTMDVAIGPDRIPTIIYVRKPRHQHAGEYRYARWEDGHWKDRKIVSAGKGRGGGWYFYGATLDHEDPSVVYLSRRTGHGRAEVEIWRTADGGRSWSTTPITSHSKTNNWRPISPLGDPGNPVLFFTGRYDGFLDFSTNIFEANGAPAG